MFQSYWFLKEVFFRNKLYLVSKWSEIKDNNIWLQDVFWLRHVTENICLHSSFSSLSWSNLSCVCTGCLYCLSAYEVKKKNVNVIWKLSKWRQVVLSFLWYPLSYLRQFIKSRQIAFMSTLLSWAEGRNPITITHTPKAKRGGGHSTEFYTGRLRPGVQPLPLLYTIFDRKGTPFVYLSLKNGTSFTYLLKNTASLF